MFSPGHHSMHPAHEATVKAHLIDTLVGHGVPKEHLHKLSTEHLHQIHKALKEGSLKHAVAKLDELVNQMGIDGTILTGGPKGTKRGGSRGHSGRGHGGYHWSKNL